MQDSKVAPAAIATHDLGKRYGDFEAVRDLTFRVERGSIETTSPCPRSKSPGIRPVTTVVGGRVVGSAEYRQTQPIRHFRWWTTTADGQIETERWKEGDTLRVVFEAIGELSEAPKESKHPIGLESGEEERSRS